jgi:hypothetical protein
MARPKAVIRPVEMSVSLPEDLHARLKLELFSELEGRVPHGRISQLFALLLREHFAALDNAQKGS